MAEIDALKRRQIAAAKEFTEIFMDGILGEAQRIAPLEEGTLAGSADRKTTVGADGSVEVIGFFSTPYAARQHEEVANRHRAGRQAKYLEAPAKRAAPLYAPGLARAVGRVT